MYISKKSLSKTEKEKVGCTASTPHQCLRLAPPTAHPPPGIYETDELRVMFSCATALSSAGVPRAASIAAASMSSNSIQFAYTLDGTPPMYTKAFNSHIYKLTSEREPLVLRGKGIYIIRAVSAKDGFVESRTSDFAFRLLGRPVGVDAGNNFSSASHAVPVPVSRRSSNLPPVLAVPLYERFAVEKNGCAGSRAGTSSVPLNRSVNASLVASSSSTTAAAAAAAPPPPLESRYIADQTAITAVRAVPCSRERDASVVIQNAALSVHIVSDLLAEQAKFNRGYKPPLPSTLPGAPVYMAPYHKQSPFLLLHRDGKKGGTSLKELEELANGVNNASASSSSSFAPAHGDFSDLQVAAALEELDISAVCGPLANAIAQQQRHDNSVQHSPNRSRNDNAIINNSGISSHSNAKQHSDISGVSLLSSSSTIKRQGLSTVRHQSAMRFGSATRGPWCTAPLAGALLDALPKDANLTRSASAEPTAVASGVAHVSKAAVVTADLTLQRRACTPALMRAYASPLDSTSFPSPLTQLMEPVMALPRRDAASKGTPQSRASVAAPCNEKQLLIEELRARAKETRQQGSCSDLMAFAAVATTVPEGTPLCAAKPIVQKMEALARKESATAAEHSRLQMLWFDAREDQLKKKQRYVAKESDNDATFNELILTHDPVERAQDREYVRVASKIVEESKMLLPPIQANDYNCTATSFFPGSDIAQTSGAFLRFYHGLGEITPYLANILRRVPYNELHLKLDSDAIRETFRSSAPADLNLLFIDFADRLVPERAYRIPAAVCAQFLRFGPSVGHLLLVMRHCVWNGAAAPLSEAPFLLLLQYCALQARPAGNYAMGDEWAEVAAFADSDGETSSSVMTAVPHIAYEMALSLYRRNLDQRHTAELAQRARRNLVEHMHAVAEQQGAMLSAAAAKLQAEKKRAVLQRMSHAAIKENAERRGHLNEVEELSRLVQWKPSAADGDDPNERGVISSSSPSAAQQQQQRRRSGMPMGSPEQKGERAPAGGNNSGKEEDSSRLAKKYGWGKHAVQTFIQDAMLARMLREMERKLPRLFATVKKSLDITSEMYVEMIPGEYTKKKE